MYTATVLLEITEFRPMTGSFENSPSCVATIYPPKDTSAVQGPYPVFSGDGQSITITVPKGYQGSVLLTYQLPSIEYVLVGIAFKPHASAGVGQLEFPIVEIIRDVTGGQMTVTDDCVHSGDDTKFEYVILVQHVASGNIGLIDPDIETENGE